MGQQEGVVHKGAGLRVDHAPFQHDHAHKTPPNPPTPPYTPIGPHVTHRPMENLWGSQGGGVDQ